MKTLFKIYLLGQLIALPFMVGALGSAFSSSDTPSTTSRSGIESPSTSAANLQGLSGQELCDALNGSVRNAVQDDIQQLRYITSELYDEGLAEDCFD